MVWKKRQHLIPILAVLAFILSGCEIDRQISTLSGYSGSKYIFLPTDPILELGSSQDQGPGLRLVVPEPFSFEQGWGNIEFWGIRGLGDRSTIETYLPDAGQRSLYLKANACPDLIKAGIGQVMSIRINGHLIGKLRLDRHMKNYKLSIPEGVLRQGRNEIEFDYSSHRSPAELGTGLDQQQLAIGLNRIALAYTRPTWKEPVSFDPERKEWTIRSAGKFILPLSDNTEGLSLEAEFSAFRSAGPCRLRRVALLPGASGLTTIAENQLNPGETRSINFPAGNGGRLQGLVFDLEPEMGRCRLKMRSMSSSESPATRKMPPGLPVVPSDHPNLVLIILDAARVDHFGTIYGYERDTTPEISRLAQDSLVFRGVTALAPYTICSIPTILTGLSFASHGIVDHGQRLSREAHTLAEILHDAGYQTLAFSGSPNDSTKLGFDQGYEEFFEAWQTSPYKDETRGFRISRRVLERLKEGLDGRPFHLLIHIVPPHEPYEPLPPYDLFTKPGYAGHANGSWHYLRRTNSNEIQIDEKDRKHIVALYDGNLLMGDAAIFQILSALQSRPDWKNTVVAITSDHGEAFREHGIIGHNATVYEEMMRVPFILHLPKGLVTKITDLNRNASLEDLCPTLLGLIGLKPDILSHGEDLLAADYQERWIYQRAAGKADWKQRSLRGFGWKFIMTKNGRKHELYDLQEDPHETSNLSLKRPELAALMAMRLVKESQKFQLIPPERQDSPLSANDQESLRALGYIQ